MMGRWSWLLIAGALLAFGCSNQGEGERCSRYAGNDGKDDCEPGLTCVRVNNLELCCPTDRTPSDPQCIAGTGTGGTGAGGAAGAAGEAGAAGADADASADAQGD